MPILPGTERAIMKLAELLPVLNRNIQILAESTKVMVLKQPIPGASTPKYVYEKVVEGHTFKLRPIGQGMEHHDGSIEIHLDRLPDPSNGKLLIMDREDAA